MFLYNLLQYIQAWIEGPETLVPHAVNIEGEEKKESREEENGKLKSIKRFKEKTEKGKEKDLTK